MPIGILLCRERLADAGGAKAQANVAIIANRVGELNESPVFFGGSEGAGRRRNDFAHLVSSRSMRKVEDLGAAGAGFSIAGRARSGGGKDSVAGLIRSLISPRSARRCSARAVWISFRLIVCPECS